MPVLQSKFKRGILWVALATTILSVNVSLDTTAAEPDSIWSEDFTSAWEEAKRLKRPMLVHFYADWCGPCRQMERTVLNSARVLKQLEGHFVAVKVNSDKQPDLIQHFNVRALPSDIFVDPNGSGTLLSQTEGYQSPERYLSKVLSISAKYQKPAKTIVAKDDSNTKASQAPPTTSENGGQTNASESSDPVNPKLGSVELTKKPVRKGLDGYSPVALSKWRKWSKGDPRFEHEYQGIVYYLASAKELREFAERPGQFAPQLLGCDPVILWKTDRAVAGSTQFGAYFDNELYLFSSEDSRRQFKVNPLKFTRTQHVLRVDQIEGSRIR